MKKNIKVFGTGCPKCKTTYNNVLEALKLTGMEADVIKIEDPRHLDEARSMGPYFQGDQSLYFASLNSGKRSVALDLSSDEGRETVLALVRSTLGR